MPNETLTETKLESLLFGTSKNTFSDTKKPSQEKRTLKPAWNDQEDSQNNLNLASKRKKYHISAEESQISAEEYRLRLRNEFQKVNGEASWASIDLIKQENPAHVKLLKKSRQFTKDVFELPSHELVYHRCVDVINNLNTAINALQFHKQSRLILVGALNKPLSFFGYGQNESTQFISSLFVDRFPFKQAKFVGNDSVVATAKSSSFFHYDLGSEKSTVVPPARGCVKGTLGAFCESTDGRLIAFHSSTRGQVHIMDLKSRELIRTYSRNGSTTASHFYGDNKILLNGDDGYVWVWDTRMHACCHKFVDVGCVRGTTITVSPDQNYIVCGSESGIVNMYSSTECLSSPSPSPLRKFSNLLTSCTQTVFDPTSSLLSILSRHRPGAIRLINARSRLVYNNFPGLGTGVSSAIDFSPTSGFMCVGDVKGTVRLYRINYFDI